LIINGNPADYTKVNAQNMFVSLGGVMQIPIPQEASPMATLAYTVAINTDTKLLEITFATPPLANTTCNIRIVTSDEFLTCLLPPELLNTALEDGPGITVNDKNQIIIIDPGIVQP
jgi:hypothetical protein